MISGEGLVIVIKYSMKAPWLERISAGVSWFSEGQPGKAQDCENTEAWGHHQPAPTITSVLYNFRKNISNIHSLSFSQIVTGSNTTCTSRYSQMSRHRFLFQTKCEKKSNSSGAMCSGLSFYYWDAVAMMLPKLYWSNLAFLGRTYVFILQSREEASKVDDDKNLCFLLCFKALTDIINWNWRQN